MPAILSLIVDGRPGAQPRRLHEMIFTHPWNAARRTGQRINTAEVKIDE